MVWICIAEIIDSKLPIFFKNSANAELIIGFLIPLFLGFIGRNTVGLCMVNRLSNWIVLFYFIAGTV